MSFKAFSLVSVCLLSVALFSNLSNADESTTPAATTGKFKILYPLGQTSLGNLLVRDTGEIFGTLNSVYGVFKLSPPVGGKTAWSYTDLGTTPDLPNSGFTVRGSAIFGTTESGVFTLVPDPKAATKWTIQQINFSGSGIPGQLNNGSLVLYKDNSLIGTSLFGGTSNRGTVYQLVPPKAGAPHWSVRVLHSFASYDFPARSPLIKDTAGNLYGAIHGSESGPIYGSIFKLTAPAPGKNAWGFSKLHSFVFSGKDGLTPSDGGLLIRKNVLYGTTTGGGSDIFSSGTIFSLEPPSPPKTAWTYKILHSFIDYGDGMEPNGGLVADSQGALYGTTYEGGLVGGLSAYGTLFKLSPPASGKTQWTFKVLHTFTGQADGGNPYLGLAIDKKGTIYGTTIKYGKFGQGTIFSYTP